MGPAEGDGGREEISAGEGGGYWLVGHRGLVIESCEVRVVLRIEDSQRYIEVSAVRILNGMRIHAQLGLPLEDVHFVSLGEEVGGGEAGDAGANDGDF